MPCPPNHWVYHLPNAVQLYVPMGHSVQSYTTVLAAGAGGYTVQLYGNNMNYNTYVPPGTQEWTVCPPNVGVGVWANPPAITPIPMPKAGLDTYDDPDLMLELIKRGYAVWLPNSAGKSDD